MIVRSFESVVSIPMISFEPAKTYRERTVSSKSSIGQRFPGCAVCKVEKKKKKLNSNPQSTEFTETGNKRIYALDIA